MGDWIDDFYKSDAPQFKGKSKEKRRKMAIAAKLAVDESLEEDTPVNNVGDGNIAGMDGTAMSKAAQKKWTSKNKTKKRKTLRNIINGETL